MNFFFNSSNIPYISLAAASVLTFLFLISKHLHLKSELKQIEISRKNNSNLYKALLQKVLKKLELNNYQIAINAFILLTTIIFRVVNFYYSADNLINKPRYVNGGIVRVYFVTDRNKETNSKATEPFNSEYSEKTAFGYCDVSIPPNHVIGHLEEPHLLKLEISYDTAKHFVLRHTTLINKSSFFSKLQGDKGSEIFIFIPGYNVGFNEAARSTAQIARDIDFSGLPVFYSWPSQNKILQYIVDGESTEASYIDLALFLKEYLQRSNKRVHLIAHSMGSRVLTKALLQVYYEYPKLLNKIQDVVLAAPDINSNYFKKAVAPKLKDSLNITLYASSKDKALQASKRVNGFPRVGDSGSELVVVDKITTIDATAVDMGFLGHSYLVESRHVLSDLYYLTRGVGPDLRYGLFEINDNNGKHWSFEN